MIQINLILLVDKIFYFQSKMPLLFSCFLAQAIGKCILTGSHLHGKGNRFTFSPVIITELRNFLSKIKSYYYISDFVHLHASTYVNPSDGTFFLPDILFPDIGA